MSIETILVSIETILGCNFDVKLGQWLEWSNITSGRNPFINGDIVDVDSIKTKGKINYETSDHIIKHIIVPILSFIVPNL